MEAAFVTRMENVYVLKQLSRSNWVFEIDHCKDQVLLGVGHLPRLAPTRLVLVLPGTRVLLSLE